MKKLSIYIIFIFFAFVGCTDLIDNTTLETTNLETTEFIIHVNVHLSEDYQTTVDFTLDGDVDLFDIAENAYEDSLVYFESEGLTESMILQQTYYSLYYSLDNLSNSNLVDAEEVENEMTVYLVLEYETYEIRYFDEFGNVLITETVAYGTNISSYYEEVIDYGIYRYESWVSLDEQTYVTMPDHDIELSTEPYPYTYYHVVYKDIDGLILKDEYIENLNDIGLNVPTISNLEDALFYNWEINESTTNLDDKYIEFLPLYIKKMQTIDTSNLEQDSLMSFLELEDGILINNVFSDRINYFDNETMTYQYDIPLPETVGSIEFSNSIVLEDIIILHGETFTYVNDEMGYDQYLLFYNIADNTITREIYLGNFSSVYLSSMGSGFGCKFLYHVDDKLYVFLQDNDGLNPRVEIFDINDTNYHETIALNTLGVDIDNISISVKLYDNLDFLLTSISEVGDTKYSKELVYGNLNHLDDVLILHSDFENTGLYFTLDSAIKDDLLVVFMENADKDLSGTYHFDLSTGMFIGRTFASLDSSDRGFDSHIKVFDDELLLYFDDVYYGYDLNDILTESFVSAQYYDDSFDAYFIDEVDCYSIHGETFRVFNPVYIYVDITDYLAEELGVFDSVNQIETDQDYFYLFLTTIKNGIDQSVILILDKNTLDFKTIIYPDLLNEELPNDFLLTADHYIKNKIIIYPIEHDSGYDVEELLIFIVE